MVNNNQENLGPAERIIKTTIDHVNHVFHNRPGAALPSRNSPIGVDWVPVAWKLENNEKVVYKLQKVGNVRRRTKLGVMRDNGDIYNGNTKVGEYRPAGLFPEAAAWIYKQVAEVWKLNNEFAAHWASYVYAQDNRDMKIILSAFMLVQNRYGNPVKENGETLFYDSDFRDVGEAMILLHTKDQKGIEPKSLFRMHKLLTLPEIAKINHDLGFGGSARKPFLGRWPRVVEKWLRYREENIPLLHGLVKSGQRRTVMRLAQLSGYKPESDKFFEILRWRQLQSSDGHRTIAIGKKVKQAESWAALSEKQICQKIINDKVSYKRIVSLVPAKIGLTRAIVAAAVEAGSFSDSDLINYSPTLEEFGLLNVAEVRARWENALNNAKNMRAANIATNVKSAAAKQRLEQASDGAIAKVGDEVTRNMRIYFIIDTSGSMEGAIESGKEYLAKFIQAFPLDKIHVSTFNTTGTEITIPHRSAAGVQTALAGIGAGGGTDYGAGVRVLQHHKPSEDEDVLFMFVGDEGAHNFTNAVRSSGLNPMAFGLIKVVNPRWPERQFAVQETARILNIPCIMINNATFSDPYAIPNVLRALIESTPVGVSGSKRVSLVEQIMKTPLLQKPLWA